jgi:hypothetical protein
MDEDFPAAHSMDSTWFAVDQKGQVGLFCTGEDGFAPSGASDPPSDDILEMLRALGGADESADWVEACGEQGFYVFDYTYPPAGLEENVLAPYVATRAPARPLHVNQLPAKARAWCSEIRFTSATFGAGPFQPIEHTACEWEAWASDACAYLNADGTVLWPIPGMEEDYRELIENCANELREGLQGVRVEGLGKKKDEDG